MIGLGGLGGRGGLGGLGDLGGLGLLLPNPPNRLLLLNPPLDEPPDDLRLPDDDLRLENPRLPPLENPPERPPPERPPPLPISISSLSIILFSLIMKKFYKKLVKEKPHGGALLKWNMGRLLFCRILGFNSRISYEVRP